MVWLNLCCIWNVVTMVVQLIHFAKTMYSVCMNAISKICCWKATLYYSLFLKPRGQGQFSGRLYSFMVPSETWHLKSITSYAYLWKGGRRCLTFSTSCFLNCSSWGGIATLLQLVAHCSLLPGGGSTFAHSTPKLGLWNTYVLLFKVFNTTVSSMYTWQIPW